jgi:predicted ATPase
MAGFLTELHVQGYACLKDVKCTLTPLHAFIGPNDSGKSTLLRAVESLFSGRYPTSFEVFAQFSDASNLYINDGGMPGVRAPCANVA